MLTRPANAPRSQANTMSLGMSAKSLVILLYEMLTEHVRRFQRWQSLRAYFILNALEVVFWGSLTYLTIQANTKFCSGTTCILSWVVAGLAILLCVLGIGMTLISYVNFQKFRDEQKDHRAMLRAQKANSENMSETGPFFEREGTHGSHGRHTREVVPPDSLRRGGQGLGLSSYNGGWNYERISPGQASPAPEQMYFSHQNYPQHGYAVRQSGYYTVGGRLSVGRNISPGYL
ncbi:hypothetical protein FDECE_3415 [Fusarium decemcellulare]|nr:hypothetical protein FDECE_3415 [Fusarium decemcellulare]